LERMLVSSEGDGGAKRALRIRNRCAQHRTVEEFFRVPRCGACVGSRRNAERLRKRHAFDTVAACRALVRARAVRADPDVPADASGFLDAFDVEAATSPPWSSGPDPRPSRCSHAQLGRLSLLLAAAFPRHRGRLERPEPVPAPGVPPEDPPGALPLRLPRPPGECPPPPRPAPRASPESLNAVDWRLPPPSRDASRALRFPTPVPASPASKCRRSPDAEGRPDGSGIRSAFTCSAMSCCQARRRFRRRGGTRRICVAAAPPREGVPGSVEAAAGLEPTLADTPELRVERNARTATKHPLGAALQIGCRQRYLILWSQSVPDRLGLPPRRCTSRPAADARCRESGVNLCVKDRPAHAVTGNRPACDLIGNARLKVV